MPDVHFQIDGVEALTFAAAPLLNFKLRMANAAGQGPIHSGLLRCQIQLAATRRRYSPQEQARLLDLFGEPERWSQTLRNMLWTHVSTTIPPFAQDTVVDLHVPCTFDFNVAATKYFYAIEQGEIPLLFLFSGTIFYAADDGALQVGQIAWDKEATFRLPAATWRAMIEHYYPNSAWLSVRQDVFDRLYAYKRQQGLPTLEQALERLLPAEEVAR